MQVYFVRVPLRVSVDHALASRRENMTGFLVLTGEDGVQGVGEFLAREYVMGETRQEIVSGLERIRRQVVGKVIDDPIELLEALWAEPDSARGKQGAMAAFDLALFDLWGSAHDTPAAALLTCKGLDRSRTILYSAVYPFASGLKLTGLHIGYAWLLRMADVKVKGSGALESDLEYVREIRRAFREPVQIRLDLNGALKPERAETYLAQMREEGITWFEQPLAKDDWDLCARYREMFRGELVLCADESVCTKGDLERAIACGAFDAINIRIGKNGGLLAARDMYERATGAGMKVQLGALVGETSVLAYAGLAFAAATAPLEHYEGCFGHYLTEWDLVQPSLTFSRGGHVSLSRLPAGGIVPEFDDRRLQAAADRQIELPLDAA
jgi:L-alanine-DL-glutamate epimerase-like enolase superfamily enzyme